MAVRVELQLPHGIAEDQIVEIQRVPVRGDIIDFAEMHPLEALAGEAFTVRRTIFPVSENGGDCDTPIVVLRKEGD